MESYPYEPSPRIHPFSSVVDGKFVLYIGEGVTSLSADSYDPLTELWSQTTITGSHPPHGLNRGASCSHKENFFLFGGRDLKLSRHNSLYQLDLSNNKLNKYSSGRKNNPMKKYGCEMIAYDKSLLILGGRCDPSYPIQPGSELVEVYGDFITNEFHSFDLEEGECVVCYRKCGNS